MSGKSDPWANRFERSNSGAGEQADSRVYTQLPNISESSELRTANGWREVQGSFKGLLRPGDRRAGSILRRGRSTYECQSLVWARGGGVRPLLRRRVRRSRNWGLHDRGGFPNVTPPGP